MKTFLFSVIASIALATGIPAYGQGLSVFVLGNDVYVAGSAGRRATLWKNGVMQQYDNRFNEWSSADSVNVSGRNVYVTTGPERVGRLWKNGEPTVLRGDGNAIGARSVHASVGGVHVAGFAGNDAVVWANDYEQRLPRRGFSEACANSVFASGGRVYAAGYVIENSRLPHKKAAVWNNGAFMRLEESRGGNCSEVKSVFVSGGNVYAVGYEGWFRGDDTIAMLWKNGKPQVLVNQKYSCANSVYVGGGNVYVAGTVGDSAVLWKNGVAQTLGKGKANSVYVSGNNVYVAGWEDIEKDGRGYVALWKNGKVQHLNREDRVSLDETKLALTVGGKAGIKAAVELNSAITKTTSKALAWTSDNAKVAAVAPDGTVTALSPGTATITATLVQGGKKADCNVTVASVTLDKTKLTLRVGKSETLAAQMHPSGTVQDVKWESSDTEVATVDANGRVTALALGQAKITAATPDDKAICELDVALDLPGVYVVGSVDGTGTLWAEGVPQTLNVEKTAGSSWVRRAGGERLTSVFVSGDDVYVAGKAGSKATLWKNGVAQRLGKEEGSTSLSVFVSGNDVYVTVWGGE
jgi:hypothetical protein